MSVRFPFPVYAVDKAGNRWKYFSCQTARQARQIVDRYREEEVFPNVRLTLTI